MNNDLISREALKKAITKATYNFEQIPIRVDKVQEIIDNAPTVEYTFEEAFQKTVCEQRLYCPQRPKGEWLFHRCNKCGKGYDKDINLDNYYFCPNCGADMRGNK